MVYDEALGQLLDNLGLKIKHQNFNFSHPVSVYTFIILFYFYVTRHLELVHFSLLFFGNWNFIYSPTLDVHLKFFRIRIILRNRHA